MPPFEKNATRAFPFTRQIRPRRRKIPIDAENATSSVFHIVRNVAFSRIVGIEREKPGANPSAALQLIGYAGGWIVDGDVQTLKEGSIPHGAVTASRASCFRGSHPPERRRSRTVPT